MEKQNLPKWFKGSEYTKGDKVRNPFSNEEYELNSIELSMYDYHSLFEKMNSAKIFSLLSEIRKKPFLQRSPLDLKRESILSTMMNEYIFKARIKYTSKK